MHVSFVLSLFLGAARAALDVDLTDSDSVKQATSLVAYDLMTYYKGNLSGNTPGVLPGPAPAVPSGPYYWWEGGALWGTLVDYWHFTGDATYNDETQYSLVFQAGAPDNSYMPPNWTASLGNDDQGFWGMSAMLAAETNFENPAASDPQWLALAQAVFNTQAPRWDNTSCNGGMRWQIPLTNSGYDYKNSIANGIFFNIGARLAHFTGNDSYAQLATRTWDWVVGVGYIDDQYNVYDGAHIEENCTDINKAQFSYNPGVYILGAAYMYNYTNGSTIWQDRITGLVNRTFDVFFPDGIIVEVACELNNTLQCTADQLSFKGYVHRWLATATQLAPFAYDLIMPTLRTSAAGAVSACSGGDNGRQCGFRWNTGTYDGVTGAGQEMSALGALSSLLVTQASVPYTSGTGGTSQGDPSAGQLPSELLPPAPATAADRAGASFITVLVLVSFTAVMIWMNTNWLEGRAGMYQKILRGPGVKA